MPTAAAARATLQDLVFEMHGAIDSRDANRLAGSTTGSAMSEPRSYGVMERLDGIAQRPLVDIVALQPIRRIVVQNADGARSSRRSATSCRRRAASRTPVALRVEQTLANGITPSRTVFGLQAPFRLLVGERCRPSGGHGAHCGAAAREAAQ